MVDLLGLAIWYLFAWAILGIVAYRDTQKRMRK